MIKQRAALAFVAFHLLSVLNFLYVKAEDHLPESLGQTFRIYNNMAGIFRDYRYFAPSVVGAVRAGYLIETADGRESFVPFAAAGREADYRYHAIILACMRNPHTRPAFARSWAALILGRRADARRVTVAVELLDLPSMADYRNGKAPKWSSIYAGTFERAPVLRRS